MPSLGIVPVPGGASAIWSCGCRAGTGFRRLSGQGCGQSRFSCSQGCCEAEEGEEQVVVVFGFADGGGDVLVAVLAGEAHNEVTESGKGAGAGFDPDLGRVLTEGDIADKVDLVLD